MIHDRAKRAGDKDLEKRSRMGQAVVIASMVACGMVSVFAIFAVIKENYVFSLLFAFLLMAYGLFSCTSARLDGLTIASDVIIFVAASMAFYFAYVLRNDRVVYRTIP